MKRLPVFLFISAAFFLNDFNVYAENIVHTKNVAIIPVEGKPGLTGLLQRIIANDGRFLLYDEKSIPVILKEWERRQSGITERDDTRELYIGEVDYIIELKPPEEPREYVLKIEITVTEVKYGGRIRSASRSRKIRIGPPSGSMSSHDVSVSNYIPMDEFLIKLIQECLNKLFPFDSKISYSDSKYVYLSSGASSGITIGQTFFIYQEDRKKTTPPRKIGLMQIDYVDETQSRGLIIHSQSINTKYAFAVDRPYKNISLELYGGIMQYDKIANLKNFINNFDSDYYYGFMAFYGFYSNRLQLGWGLSANYPGRGPVTRISASDLTLRNNIHIFRRLFLYTEFGLSIEFLDTKDSIRTAENIDGTDYTSREENGVYVWDALEQKLETGVVTANAGLGSRFMLNDNLYLFTRANWYIASSHTWDQYGSIKGAQKGSDQFNEIKEKKIDSYDRKIENFSPAGLRFVFGAGYHF